MTTLAETLKQNKLLGKEPIQKFCISASDVTLAGVFKERWLVSKEFVYMRVPLSRLGVSYGEILASSDTPKGLVVVDVNKNKVGKTAGGFTPKAVVVSGSTIIKAAKARDEVFINCWVGRKCVKALGLSMLADQALPTDSAIKITKQLRAKFPKSRPYLVDLSASSATFSMDGDRYKIKIDAGKLDGDIMALNPSTYTTHMEPDGAGMPPLSTNLVRSDIADARSFGSPNSDLNNPNRYEDGLDVNETLDIYLNHLKEGIWKPVSSQWAPIPPNVVAEANEVKAAAKKLGLKTFAVMDFLHWKKTMQAANVKIKAGGPGSGRRKTTFSEDNKVKRERAHDRLKENGWRKTGTSKASGSSSYQHPDKPKEHILVHRDGSWEHQRVFGLHDRIAEEQLGGGSTPESLGPHLSSLK